MTSRLISGAILVWENLGKRHGGHYEQEEWHSQTTFTLEQMLRIRNVYIQNMNPESKLSGFVSHESGNF